MLLVFILAAVFSARATQVPFTAEHSSNSYEFEWPIKKVAIIGAGVSGLVSYREFTRPEFNFSVRLFERDSVPGGTWHYTDETPKDAPIPNVDPSIGDYVPTLPPPHQALPYEEIYHDNSSIHSWRWKDHRAPRQAWKSLVANTPPPTQEIREFPWPKNTPWILPHETLGRYLRAFASWCGVNSNDGNPDISYSTRVESVTERYTRASNGTLTRHGWTLTLKKLVKIGETTSKAIWWTEDFDAVVVATGRYNAPNIPNIQGLPKWKARFPQSITHSREYRYPDEFTNKTIMVVGAAASGAEIAREINSYARNVYVSIRESNKTGTQALIAAIALGRIPRNASIIGEIQQFNTLTASATDISSGEILLKNGTTITGVDHIIFATGFDLGFPFLKQYHDPSLGLHDRAPEGKPQPLVTDGTHVRSLYLDLFYIEEPTIGFVNMNSGMEGFTYCEFLSLTLAKVWADRAKLPPTNELWRVHNQHVEERGGYGRSYLFLGPWAKTYQEIFTAWLNSAVVRYGGRMIAPPPDHNFILGLWIQGRYGVDFFGDDAGINAAESREERTARVYDLAFANDW